MYRTYAANALPAMTCDDGPAAQQWQEYAKALRVAQGVAEACHCVLRVLRGSPHDHLLFLSRFYGIPMPFLCGFYPVSIPFLYRFSLKYIPFSAERIEKHASQNNFTEFAVTTKPSEAVDKSAPNP